MIKKDLLKLKKSLLMVIISTCLVGCEVKKEEPQKQTLQEYIETEKKKERMLDKHCIIDAGDEKIIFRNCDADYWVDYIPTYDGKKILRVYCDEEFLFELETSNYLYYTVDSQLMIDYEQLLAEQGARVYQRKK